MVAVISKQEQSLKNKKENFMKIYQIATLCAILTAFTSYQINTMYSALVDSEAAETGQTPAQIAQGLAAQAKAAAATPKAQAAAQIAAAQAGLADAQAPKISVLNNIFILDDVQALQNFAKENPTFAWTALHNNFFTFSGTYDVWAASGEEVTPLILATFLGAKASVKYLLQHKHLFGNIQSSINTKSSHGYTAIQYAQHPPKEQSSPNQTPKKFNSIIKTLESYGAQ